MPKAPTKKQAAQNLVNKIADLREAGQFEESDALRAEAESAIQACRPQDRAALTADLEHTFETFPAPVERTKDLAISSYHDVDGVDDIVSQGVRLAKRAVNAGLKAADMAGTVADTLLDARLKMPNPDTGLPDIIAQRKYTKNIAHDMFVKAREGVTEEGDIVRWNTHKSLAKAVRNRMSDVMVARLKSLDEDPDKARELFPMIEFTDGQSRTEAVYAAYAAKGIDLPRKGRTELAREDARRRAELVRRAVAGELPAGDDQEDEGEELSRDMAALERVERNFISTTKRAESLTPEARAKLKQRINEMITNLAAAAAGL